MLDFNVVQWASDNLSKLLPWRMIFDYERGVRWTLGRWPKALKPGVRLCIWGMHRVDQFSVVERIVKLETQSVFTKKSETEEAASVCFVVNVGIEIDNPVWYATKVHDFEDSLKDLAMSHLASRVRGKTLSELAGEGGLADLEASLKGTLTTRLTKWGAVVTHVGFTNFVPVTQQVRLFQDHRPGALA